MKKIVELNKPGILIISKSGSGACRDLGISMSKNEEMIKLAKEFVMILAPDNNEPEDEKYLPGIIAFSFLNM